MSPAVRTEFVGKAEALAFDQMLHAPTKDKRIIWFRGFRNLAETGTARGHLKEILSGRLTVPDVELRPLDRWNIVATLIALNDPEAGVFLAAEQQRDPSGEGQKYAYLAQAARPDGKSKQQYFDDYLHNAARPEDWVEQSLGDFNYWNQAELTAPYLRPALDALPQVKRERKIFFMLAWLNAFIGRFHQYGRARQRPETEAARGLRRAGPDRQYSKEVPIGERRAVHYFALDSGC